MEIHQILAEALGISDADRIVVFTFAGYADTLSGRVREFLRL
jgi:anaerobic selenocysteine-containing dehydrogenase